MKTFKSLFITGSLLLGTNALAQPELQQAILHCQSISENTQRLACFDAIQTNSATADAVSDAQANNLSHAAQNPHKDEFPALIADLNEPNLFISVGSLDFLGSSARSVLIGGGKRQSVKDFELSNGRSLAFNVFGQIRSQFDVNDISTRNNRGGALINTDFRVGGEIVQSLDNWNWRFSYTHKSTHLGDEFLIDNPEYLEKRLNLSYETVRWDAHKAINNWDLYAGLGFITRSEPGDLAQIMWQAGWQFQGEPWRLIKPIWAVDLSSWQAADWNIHVTVRAGIEVHQLTNSPFQLLLEYQDGRSPYGQFYTEDLTFAGLTFLKNW